MNSFVELIERSTQFTLFTLEKIQQSSLKELEISAATVHVNNLQMIQLQKTIFAVGMFSIFEANLQQNLNCKDGFKEAKKILIANNKIDIECKFNNYLLSINVLKHGYGNSYDKLIAKKDNLPFKVKSHGENFFEEGDISEMMTLIYVDDYYLNDCAAIIRTVNEAIRDVKSDYLG